MIFKQIFLGKVNTVFRGWQAAKKEFPETVGKTKSLEESKNDSRFGQAKFHREIDAECMNSEKGICKHVLAPPAALKREKTKAGLLGKRGFKAWLFYGRTK